MTPSAAGGCGTSQDNASYKPQQRCCSKQQDWLGGTTKQYFERRDTDPPCSLQELCDSELACSAVTELRSAMRRTSCSSGMISCTVPLSANSIRPSSSCRVLYQRKVICQPSGEDNAVGFARSTTIRRGCIRNRWNNLCATPHT